MPSDEKLTPLFLALKAIVVWFESKKVSFVIIGGVAASIIGRPRLTRDIDILTMLDIDRWNDLLDDSSGFGFTPRISDALDFAKKNRVLLLRHSEGVDVDISFGVLPFEKEVITRSKWYKINDIKIPIPTPEDLIILKAVAHRQQDLSDIEAIVEVCTELDIKRIQFWTNEFAKALEMPELMEDLNRIIAKYKK